MFYPNGDETLFSCDNCTAEVMVQLPFLAAWEDVKSKGWQPASVGSSIVFGSLLCPKCVGKL